MSKIILFSVNDKADYYLINNISRNIVQLCLNEKIGVSFNFLGYCDDIIKEMNPTFYFSISDDFIQLNSEFLNTSDIEDIESKEGELEFKQKFYIFDQIYNILKSYDLNEIKLLIVTDGSTNSIKECEKICKDEISITDILYRTVVAKKEEFAYDFPNLLILLDD